MSSEVVAATPLAGARASARERDRFSRPVIALMAFLTLVDLFATQAILPSLARAYQVAPSAMGFAVNASAMGMAISSLAIAFFNHRVDQRRGVVFSLALLAIPTCLLAIAPDLMVFTALRIAQGLRPPPT